MDASPNPSPTPVSPAAAPVAPAAPPALVFTPAPDGLTCKICNAPLRYSTESAQSQEFVCSTLKNEAPILEDKYQDWRNHFIGSRVIRSK